MGLSCSKEKRSGCEGASRLAPRVISLFSGAGGLDLGFVQMGFSIVWANDIDPDAVRTYQANLGNHIVLGDISEVDVTTLPDCDVLIGGFPCQGFSEANTKRGMGDARNQLYKQYLRVLREKRPAVFVAENVRGILTIAGGEAIRTIVGDFSDAGYRVQYRLLNAADYGVPQQRRRVFIVGIRNDLDADFLYPSPTNEKNGEGGLAPWKSVRAALSGIPDPDGPDADKVPNNTYSKYKMVMNGYLGKRPLDPDSPAPTVTARGDRKGGVVVLPNPLHNRRMTVRELATIQDFPLDYRFCGAQTDCYRQIGNAVPVGLARAVATSVMGVCSEVL